MSPLSRANHSNEILFSIVDQKRIVSLVGFPLLEIESYPRLSTASSQHRHFRARDKFLPPIRLRRKTKIYQWRYNPLHCPCSGATTAQQRGQKLWKNSRFLSRYFVFILSPSARSASIASLLPRAPPRRNRGFVRTLTIQSLNHNNKRRVMYRAATPALT